MVQSSLETYHSKRDFKSTPEPRGRARRKKGHAFVIQKHDATRLHYDFRLELDGVLKSWAVTRGPSLDPADKRLAVRTEDHPVEYGDFEGVIPKGYGAGTVILWDRGEWEPQGDPHEGLEKGSLKFFLKGERLQGGYALVRMKNRNGEKRENWLLIKERDSFVDKDLDPTEEWTTSVASGRDIEATRADWENGADAARTWNSTTPAEKAAATSRAKRKGKAVAGRSASRAGSGKPPAFVAPQLATLRDAPPDGDEWVHELKYDGYRIQALIGGGRVRLMTRNEKDWTERYPGIAEALKAVEVEEAILDGELVAVDEDGHSRFGMLQNSGDPAALRYYVFDLLRLDGKDLTKTPLLERKALLQPLVPKSGPIRYSDHIEGDGDRVIAKACAMHLEGIVSKKATAPYRSGRGTAWVKSKCIGNDEYVVAGYRKSDKRGRPFSSLLLGEYVDGTLVYRGRVGTGFDDRTMDRLIARMRKLERKTPPYGETPREARAGAVWLKPELVAQIAYTEVTGDGRLRHPSFLGLREDKPAEEVRMEDEGKKASAGGGTAKGSAKSAGKDTGSAKASDGGATDTVAGVRLTSPDKVMFPDQGATKRAIAGYLARHADTILATLKDRPVSLVRCPSGRGGKCFFQKHHTDAMPKDVGAVDIAEKDGGTSAYLTVGTAKGLVSLAQIGVLEFHIWGARADDVEKPERVVFDLDPDESLGFEDVKRAAFELRDLLQGAGLKTFPLLTGGKGVHVIAPLQRRRGWGDVKAFAKGFATKLAEADPERYIATMSKARRKGKIFIDWLRNERGATAVAPYSLRARLGAPVATPVSWDELEDIDSAAAFTLETIDARLKAAPEPWAGYAATRQSITDKLMEFVSG